MNWLFRKMSTPPAPLIELKRQYRFGDLVSGEYIWRKPVLATSARMVVDDTYVEIVRSRRTWIKIDYEAVWCVPSSEVVYIKTEYFDNGTYRFTTLDEKPTDPPKIIEKKPSIRTFEQ